jgi:proline iminopeptidase
MQENVNDKGHLDVGDGHQIYWEDWGNPEGAPIIHLHGGPGSNFKDAHKELYDPAKHHVIFHDQRGCGQSKPFASTENNTAQNLIHDMELLRAKFGFEKVHVAGGSWGSSLGLLYTIAHPDRVSSLLLWSIYLIRQSETDWVNEGHPRYNFPAEWARFIAFVPEEHRESGDKIMSYYAAQMRGDNKESARKYATEWTLWEATLLSITYDPAKIEAEVTNDPNVIATALLQTHYFLNKCFVPENYILNNINKIKHIPCSVVHGRFDMCTPPIGAYDLALSYGDQLELQWVNAGHLRSDPEMLKAMKAAAASQLVK